MVSGCRWSSLVNESLILATLQTKNIVLIQYLIESLWWNFRVELRLVSKLSASNLVAIEGEEPFGQSLAAFDTSAALAPQLTQQRLNMFSRPIRKHFH